MFTLIPRFVLWQENQSGWYSHWTEWADLRSQQEESCSQIRHWSETHTQKASLLDISHVSPSLIRCPWWAKILVKPALECRGCPLVVLIVLTLIHGLYPNNNCALLWLGFHWLLNKLLIGNILNKRNSKHNDLNAINHLFCMMLFIILLMQYPIF